MIIQKYVLDNMENIDYKYSNSSWRWKDFQSRSKRIMNKLFWEVRIGEEISIKSHFWWLVVGLMPQGV